MQEQSSTYKFDIPLDFFLQWNQPVIMMMKESWNLQMLFCQMIFIFPCTVRRNCFMYGDIVMNLTRTITGITWRSCWIKWLSKMMYGMQRTDRSELCRCIQKADFSDSTKFLTRHAQAYGLVEFSRENS